MKTKTRQIIWFIIGVVLAISLDQWTKWLAVQHLKDQASIPIWEGVFELAYVENPGAAFGMLEGKQGFFFVIAVVVMAATVYVMWKMPLSKHYVPLYVCAILICAGAIGNMIDRISQGFVVDFFYFKLIDFPVFNVADCYVVVATFSLILLTMLFYSDEDLSVFSIKKGERT